MTFARRSALHRLVTNRGKKLKAIVLDPAMLIVSLRVIRISVHFHSPLGKAVSWAGDGRRGEREGLVTTPQARWPRDGPAHQVRMATALCNQVWKIQARTEIAHDSGHPSQGSVSSGGGAF